MNKTNIRHWHSTYNDWLRALNFYKEEISILRNRLTEIAEKNTGKEVLAHIEHFENQFTLHTENIDRLKHDININVSAIVNNAAVHTGFIENKLLNKLDEQNIQYATEEKLVNELRHSFYNFSADWM